jgi:hypothetical protein
MDNIIKIKNFNFENIIFDKPYINDNNITIKLWYKYDDNKIENFFIQNSKLQILNSNDETLNIIINENTEEFNFYETFDKHVIDHLKKLNIFKKYKIYNIDYKSILHEIKELPCLNLKITTKHIYNSKKELIELFDLKKFTKNNNVVKSIIEFDSIDINITNSIIKVNIILSQLCFSNSSNKKIVTLDNYSFIDTDKDSVDNDDTNNDNDNDDDDDDNDDSDYNDDSDDNDDSDNYENSIDSISDDNSDDDINDNNTNTIELNDDNEYSD